VQTCSWSPAIPPWGTVLWLAPALALFILAAGGLSGWLKLRRGARTGDTRKLFHFAIFTCAALLAGTLGLPAVNLLGGLMGLFILWILCRGEGSLFYEGLGREADHPRRSLHILVPFLATAAGGIASALLFGRYAIVGYAVAGWGDAVAEPVGIRWGKRRYRVPGLGGVASWRSLEGSAAVFAASFAAAAIALSLPALGDAAGLGPRLLVACGVAAAAALVEAVSHHGLDNLTVQLAASGAASGLAAWAC
jgi:phytol kinase